MHRMMRLALVFCLLAAQAQAGAWPRERGTWFASAAAQLTWPQDLSTLHSPQPTGQYYTLYAEYGLTERITLGLDLGRAGSGGGKTVAFARMPVSPGDRALQIAVELGLGQIDGAKVLRPGVSVGRGITLWERSGWLSLDSVAEVLLDSGQTDFKIDMTFGLTGHSGRKYMLQMQTGAPAARPAFARLAPSVAIPLGNARHIEIGGSYGLTGDENFGIKLGLWQKF